METESIKLKNKSLFFYMICLGGYIILKMYRNSLDSSTDVQGGIWNIINALFVVAAASLAYMRKNVIVDKPAPLKWAYAYSFIALFFSLLNFSTISVSTVFNLLMIFYFPSVMLVFYAFGRYGVGEREQTLFMIIFYIVAAFCLYLMILRMDGKNNVYQSDMYFLLCLTPFIFLWKKNTSFYIPIAICASVIILSGKRTATLAILGALFVYYYIQTKTEHNMKAFFDAIFKISFMAIIIFAVYMVLSENYDINIIERLENMSEDGGSGRDKIYEGVFNAIKESPPYRWFVGYGDKAITTSYGRATSAHNDFLEIMYDYGIFAIIAIVGFYISLILEARTMIKDNYKGAAAFAASIVISIFMSMFTNYLITFTHISGMAAFWGICLADYKKHRCGNYKIQIPEEKYIYRSI